MALFGGTRIGPGGGISIGNAPRGAWHFSVSMIPTPVMMVQSFERLGVDIRSFREPLTRAVREVVSPSFRKNFDVGGRPSWEPLSPYTLSHRGIGAEGRVGVELAGGAGTILVRSGLLSRVAGQLNIWTFTKEEAYVSGNLPRAKYGTWQQTGYVGGFDAETPARPWAVIQEEDAAKVEDIFVDWFRERALRAGVITR